MAKRRYLARTEGRSRGGAPIWVVRDTLLGEIPLLKTTDQDEAKDFERAKNREWRANLDEAASRQLSIMDAIT